MPTNPSTTYRPIVVGTGSTASAPSALRSCGSLQHSYGVLQTAMHQVERAAERGDLVLALDLVFRNVGLARADIARQRGDLLDRLDDEEVQQHVQHAQRDQEDPAQRRHEGE